MNSWSRVVERLPLSPSGRTWLARGFAAVGFALLAQTLLAHGIEGDGGGGGIDSEAYLFAARNLVAGTPLYDAGVGTFRAYTYPPLLAQLLSPVAGMPIPAFVWLWRGLELLSLRVAVGSWRTAGIAILVFPPMLAEFDAANIHLVMAAACSMAMRRQAVAVFPAALLKFASLPLVPMSWFRDRRGLVIGAAITFGVTAISIAAAADRWREYVTFLQLAEFPTGWYNIAAGIPLPLRLAAAGVLGVAAVRWVRLAPFAILVAYPVIWLHSLSTLVSVVTPLPAPMPVPASVPTKPVAGGSPVASSAR